MYHENKTDICIIGAGPVGLFSIFQAGMLNMKCHVVDALSFPGGQCAALYPEKPIYDIPAYKKITGQELTDNLLKQAESFDPIFHYSSIAENLDGDEVNGYKITINNINTNIKSYIYCKVIVIASGSGIFGPNKPPIENIEKYEDKNIFYYINDITKFRGKNITIAGGGDSAIDWAINLSEIANKVYLIHRRENFRCLPSNQDKVYEMSQNGLIELLIPFQLHSLIEEGNNMIGIKIENTDNNEFIDIKTDFLLPFFGLKVTLGKMLEWGINFDKKLIKIDTSTMETSKPGIYAIGDSCQYDGKLKLILCGFSEAAIAMHSAYKYVFPGKALHFQHSTSRNLP